jgi:hypothetical protein
MLRLRQGGVRPAAPVPAEDRAHAMIGRGAVRPRGEGRKNLGTLMVLDLAVAP